MAPTRTAAFSAAVWMVHWIHGNATYCRSDATPSAGAGFPELSEVVLVIANFADRCPTVDMHFPHFARTETNRDVGAFARDDLCRGTGRARQLCALTRLELKTMYLRTHRNALELQCATRPYRRFATCHDWIANRYSLRRQNVAPLTIAINNESDMRTSIGIVLQALYLARNTVLVALEVDNSIVPPMTTAFVPRRNTTLIVAATGLGQRHDQPFMRPTFV